MHVRLSDGSKLAMHANIGHVSSPSQVMYPTSRPSMLVYSGSMQTFHQRGTESVDEADRNLI